LSAGTALHAPKPTFAPARWRSGKQSSEQRHVNLQRLELQPLSHQQVMKLI
jgi:hypothetical protein